MIDRTAIDYSLEVLHTYNDDQTLFSIIINLVRDKCNKNVGQANLLFESNSGQSSPRCTCWL